MNKREKYWQMFTESGDPLAYIEYRKSTGRLFKRAKKHEDV